MGNKSSKHADPHSSIVPAKRIERLDFPALVTAIRQLHEHLSAQAGRAVNISLTMRNWTIGLYIAEYELRGADRATYGENLLAALAERLKRLRVSNCSRRQLYRYLRFYRLYPRIVGTLPPQLKALLPTKARDLEKVGTLSPQFQIPAERFIQGLSYSHIELIVDLDDEVPRESTVDAFLGHPTASLLRQLLPHSHRGRDVGGHKEPL